MAKEHTVNLSCSFCGKTQREVKKLIAGPTVYICDECIGLCIDIIGEEVSSADTPLAARRCLEWETQRTKSHTDGLLEIVRVRESEIPAHVRLVVSRLAETVADAQAAMEAWNVLPGDPVAEAPLPVWATVVVGRLSSIEEVVGALRAALERSIPTERLATFDHILRELSAAKRAVGSGARVGRPATSRDPSSDPSAAH